MSPSRRARPPFRSPRRSGHLIQRPVASLWGRQATALGGTRTALYAVGVVDDHVHLAVLWRILGDLVHPSRTHPAPGFGGLPGHAFADADVVGGIVAGGVAGDEHR